MIYLLQQLLSQSAAKYPDKAAIIFKEQLLTYRDLDQETNRVAHTLMLLGIKKGECVGIHMNRCINSIIGALGIMKAGLIYVPLDPNSPPTRLNYIINRCKIRFILTSREKLTNIGNIISETTCLEGAIVMNGMDSISGSTINCKLIDWQKIQEGTTRNPVSINIIDSDLAYILFTSGSTGNPKGVMISHLNSLTFINSACDFFKIKADDIFSNISPLHFDMSVFEIYVALKAGATVAIIPESTTVFPVKLAELIVNSRITVWNSVPSALSLLANMNNLESFDLSSLRLILFAGEQFPLKYLRRLKEIIPKARFCNMYGQTEANSSTYYWVEDIPSEVNAKLPIGKSLPNFEVFALDENGNQVLQSEEEGELYVRASSVASGYLGDDEKTKANFVINPLKPELNEIVYRTGDLVSLDSAGNFVFQGRKDHMIKCRGYRIEIGEIETVLSNHPDIKNTVVIPCPDELIGNRIYAFVVLYPSKNINKQSVLDFCFKHLPKYMIPEDIEFCESIPMTSSGKVDRQKLSMSLPFRKK